MTSLMVHAVSGERIFFVGAGMIMISMTEVQGCPAIMLTHNKERVDDPAGTPVSEADVDEDWFRENSVVIAFASAEGACNFLERINDMMVEHGKKIGFVDEDGNIKEEYK